MNLILASKVQSLKERLVLEKERTDMSKSKEEEIKQNELKVHGDLES
jgi:hypothetical protein